MAYAVVQTGGKQHRVEKGSRFRVEKLPGSVGETVKLDEVLMLGGDKVAIGTPTIAGAQVTAKIVGQTRGPKVIVFKFAGPLHDVEPLEHGAPPDPLFSAAAMRSAAAGVIVLPVVWFVAQSTMKAQVIGAVFFGSESAKSFCSPGSVFRLNNCTVLFSK